MDSRERILQALSHREPDKVPLDIQGMGASRVYAKPMRAFCELAGQKCDFDADIEGFAVLSEGLLDRLKVDTRGVAARAPEETKSWREGETVFVENEMGVISARPPSSIYFDTVLNPMSGVTCIDDVRNFPWPDPEEPSRFCGLEQKISRLKGLFAVILTPFLPGVFETLISLCGYERTMAGLIEDRSLFQYIIDRIVEIKCSFYRKLGKSITEFPDIVFETDDLGTQNGPLISPRMYRELFLPAHKKVIDEIKKSLAGVKVLLHSCGSIRWALPMLIDAGVDIINPVQPGAKDMDLKELKREFGDSLVFWGASVDPQKTLVTGTPQMIEHEVRDHIETLSVNGGFVLAPVHNIQPDVPGRNLMAFLKAIERYR